MKKPLAASKSLMQNYLAELLTEEPDVPLQDQAVQSSAAESTFATSKAPATAALEKNQPVAPLKAQPAASSKPASGLRQQPEPTAVDEHKQKLNKLLQRANVANNPLSPPLKSKRGSSVLETEQLPKQHDAKQVYEKQVDTKQVYAKQARQKQTEPPHVDDAPLVTAKSQADFVVKVDKNYRKGSFQAMFFDVAGLLIAVPLIELGGIHQIEKITSLMGKPDWYKGVMLYREDKINVVDTALWVMPEKCNETLLNALSYQYIIMLGSTAWGMMAENLVDTVTLQQEDVKWLDNNVKRPWLAGLVKDRMCALLDVDALVKMLDDGAEIR